MVRWDADADRMLLIAVIQGAPVQLGPETVERVSQAYPIDIETGERPTGKAITERIYRIKSMFKKHGTAEPRRAMKKLDAVEVGEGEHGGTPTPTKVRKPRTPKVSTDKVTKPKPKPKITKVKRSKSKANSEDASDDEDFKPKAQISREAKALLKENPDFGRYGKEATPSRRRNKKAVSYTEEDIKGEPQSDEEDAGNNTTTDPFVDASPKPLHPAPIDTAAAQAYGSQGFSHSANHLHYPEVASSPHAGPMSYSSNVPMHSQMTPNFPASYIASPSLSMNNYGTTTNTYPTPNSSFSSNDTGYSEITPYQNTRHDSVLNNHNFVTWNNAGHEPMQNLQASSMPYHSQSFDALNTPISHHAQASTMSPFARPHMRQISNNTLSQLGGLRRAATYHGSLPNSVPMTPVTPHMAFPPQALTPDPSPEHDMENSKQGLGIDLMSPNHHHSMISSNHGTMPSGQMDGTYTGHFDDPGLGMDNSVDLDNLNFDADVF